MSNCFFFFFSFVGMVFKSQGKNGSPTPSRSVTEVRCPWMELSLAPSLYNQQSGVISRELASPPPCPFAFWPSEPWWSANLLFPGASDSSDNRPTDVSPAFIRLQWLSSAPQHYSGPTLKQTCLETRGRFPSTPPLLGTSKDPSAKPSWAVMRRAFSWARAGVQQNLNRWT